MIRRPMYPVTGIAFSPDGALSTAELDAWAKQCTQWLGDVIAPWWARFMTIRAIDPNVARDPDAPQIAFMHHEKIAGALGHHFADKGAIRSIIAVDESARQGGWQDTGDHEAAEQTVDPSGQDVRLIGSLIVPVEIMDMTEDDAGGHNCVTPAYFDADMARAGVPVDDQGNLSRGADVDGVLPCTAGGYCAYYDISMPSAGWQQAGAARKLAPHSRLARKLARLAPHAARVAAAWAARSEFDISDVTPTDRTK
jgi:hypothetical protein